LGDYWFDTTTNNIRTWVTPGKWGVPSLDDIHIDNGTISTQITDLKLSSSGNLILGNLTWPSVDGTTNQVLSTDGTGTLQFINQPKFLPSWTLTGNTTPLSTTATLTKRSDSIETSNEITLPANSGNTLKVLLQGYSSDNSTHISSEIVIPVQQIGTASPIVGPAYDTHYIGSGLFSISATGLVNTGVPYVRLSVTALSTATSKYINWSAHISVFSTQIIT
jgi:hypothetical protein